jgi:Ca2+-binding EF-hand superfamily protein
MEKLQDEKSISIFSDDENHLDNIKKLKVDIKKVKLDKKDLNSDKSITIEAEPPKNQLMETLKNIKTPFQLDLIKFASDAFEIYIKEVKKNKFDTTDKIDMYEIKNLLDVIGIKKNDFEINNKLIELKSEHPKKFRDDKYSKECFLDVVEAFKNYRIDEKLLVAFYRALDKEEDGTVGFFDLKRISAEKKLNFSDEEIYEILQFFEMEDRVINNNPIPDSGEEEDEKYFLTFEKFCKIYYQG